ncbi:hypothetical protein [Marinomonas communis]|uniref:hypothetical protein n=1 Tax=Marinomonas communis TaxID=28254 RepID=UPI00105ED64B|nr:hypothetical protein [Marinomonas communis]
MILDCIRKLSTESNVYVITRDQHLSGCCTSLNTITVCTSLDDLFEENDIKKAIIDLDSVDGRINSILETLESSSGSISIQEFISEFKREEYLDKDFLYDSIDLPYDLKEIVDSSNNWSVQAEILGELDFNDLYVSKAKFLGGNKFSLSTNMECLLELHVFCSPETYETLPYEYRKKLECDEELTDGEEHIFGVLRGYLESNIVIDAIDLNINPHALEVHLSYLGQDRCELEVEVESINLDIISL